MTAAREAWQRQPARRGGAARLRPPVGRLPAPGGRHAAEPAARLRQPRGGDDDRPARRRAFRRRLGPHASLRPAHPRPRPRGHRIGVPDRRPPARAAGCWSASRPPSRRARRERAPARNTAERHRAPRCRAPPFFERLWRHLHCDPRRLPYRWQREDGRLLCRLRPLTDGQRLFLSSERVADRPDIELRIAAPPGREPFLAEVALPAVDVARRGQGVHLPRAGRVAGQLVRPRLPLVRGRRPRPAAPGRRAGRRRRARSAWPRACARWSPTRRTGTPAASSSTAAPAGRCRRPRSGPGEHLGVRDPGRTVRLVVPHRMQPPPGRRPRRRPVPRRRVVPSRRPPVRPARPWNSCRCPRRPATGDRPRPAHAAMPAREAPAWKPTWPTCRTTTGCRANSAPPCRAQGFGQLHGGGRRRPRPGTHRRRLPGGDAAAGRGRPLPGAGRVDPAADRRSPVAGRPARAARGRAGRASASGIRHRAACR